MKLILALILCGVAYATESPTCTESELNRCSSYMPVTDDEDYKATEEYLNKACKSIGCMKDYKERCGVESVDKYWKAMLVLSEKSYRALCDTDSQVMRKKYFDKIKCINTVMSYAIDECSVGGQLDFGDPENCPRIKVRLDCMSEMVEIHCGTDAREVNDAISPGLEFHGCKE